MSKAALVAAGLLAAVTPTAAQDVPAAPATGANAVVAARCATCHSRLARSAGLTLQGFDVHSPLVSAPLLETMIRKVRAGQMPPAGAPRLSDNDRAGLVDALEAQADAIAARAPAPASRALARLNRAEYALAVRDLLGIELDAAALLPPDTVSGGFDNVAEVQTPSATLLMAYLRAAAQASRKAVANRTSVPAGTGRSSTGRPRAGASPLDTCTAAVPAAEPGCARDILARLTAAAYRGRGNDADLTEALAFYDRGRLQGTFDDGLRLAVQAVLMSPKFLLRLEPATADGQADGLAVASRLSFFLWSRGPDAALLAAAQSGALQTAAQLEAQARRMLRDARAVAVATRFAAQWLRLQDLDKTVPDPALFPTASRALLGDMRQETERFVSDLVTRDGSVMELITSNRSFVNARLAAHYGIAGVRGEQFRAVTMPATRRGLLGQASILTLTSLGDRTSPVLRGKWVLDVLLGTPPPPPPPVVPPLDDTASTAADGAALSTRQRVEMHRRNPACGSCHRVIDPPGLTLEQFDAVGAWRDADNTVPVDVSAQLYDGQDMSGPAGLRAALLTHEDMVLRNFTEQLMSYALARRLTYRDMPVVRAVVRHAAARGNRLSAFVAGIVTSAAFRAAAPPERP